MAPKGLSRTLHHDTRGLRRHTQPQNDGGLERFGNGRPIGNIATRQHGALLVFPRINGLKRKSNKNQKQPDPRQGQFAQKKRMITPIIPRLRPTIVQRCSGIVTSQGNSLCVLRLSIRGNRRKPLLATPGATISTLEAMAERLTKGRPRRPKGQGLSPDG